MLLTRRQVPFNLHWLISAAYEPIAARIIEVDAGDATAINPARFTYKLERRPLFGLP